MYRPRELGGILHEAIKSRALSARAASLRAGLSPNVARMIVRGSHRPTAATLEALADALGLPQDARRRMRILAGIESDPAAAPAARRARRDAWRPLLYVLANHVWLPRLELAARRAALRSKRDRALVDAALAAPTAAHFVDAASDAKAPSKSLQARIEETFGDAGPDAVAELARAAQRAADVARPDGDLGAARLDWRWGIARLLLRWNRPPLPEAKLRSLFAAGGFDYSFAHCFFPALYWHACRAWPFERVRISPALRDDSVQRRLYDAVRAGLDLPSFSLALVGETPLGVEIANAPRARPSPPMRAMPRGDERPDQQSAPDIWFDAAPGWHATLSPGAPPDRVFDHCDRCDFLARFPLIRVDREHFAALARALALPSWQRWSDYVARHYAGLMAQRPNVTWAPLTAERFVYVSSTSWVRDQTRDTPETLDSYLLSSLTHALAECAAVAAGRKQWAALAAAARALGLHPDWRALVESLRSSQRSADSRAGGTPAD